MLLREAGTVSKSASAYSQTHRQSFRQRVTKLAHRNRQRGVHRLLLVNVLDERQRLANRVQRLAHRLVDLVQQCFPQAPLRVASARVVGGRAVRRHDGCKRERVVAANLAEAVKRCRRDRRCDCGKGSRGLVPLRGEKRGGGRVRGERKRGSEAEQREDAKEAEQVGRAELGPRDPAGGRDGALRRGNRGRLDVGRRARVCGRRRGAAGQITSAAEDALVAVRSEQGREPVVAADRGDALGADDRGGRALAPLLAARVRRDGPVGDARRGGLLPWNLVGRDGPIGVARRGGLLLDRRQRRAARRRRRESRGAFGDAVGGRRWVDRGGVRGAVGLALALEG
mmetsp:Transcript_27308/g.80223  ORF Transcript_27308/g.80223 Transcript_27308/m.80223 type:complete len:340 (+) Transcript_27308:1049-2068(+)